MLHRSESGDWPRRRTRPQSLELAEVVVELELVGVAAEWEPVSYR